MPTESSPPHAPAIDGGEPTPRAFELRDGEFRIALARAAYDEVLAHGATNPDLELCGVLVGNVHTDAEGPYLVVEAAIRGREAREEANHVTFTHSTWEHINHELDRKHPAARIVGWYHMHPGFGVFLSEVDLFAHRHFFNAPWQIAMVVDPKAQREGLFIWEHGQVVRSRRYWIGDEVRWEPGQRSSIATPPGTTAGAAGASPPRGEATGAAEPDASGDLRSLPLWVALAAVFALAFWNLQLTQAHAQLAFEAAELRHRAELLTRLLPEPPATRKPADPSASPPER